MKPPATRSHRDSRLITSLLIALGSALLVSYFPYRREMGGIEQRLRDREIVRLSVLAHVFRSDFQAVSSDLRGLREGDGLQAFLADGRAEDLERARRRAVFFSQLHGEYDEVRFVDNLGREIFRVDRAGAVRSSAQTDDQADQAYFQRARTLQPNELFVSSFALKLRDGRVQQPLQPLLRFAIPVFDATGARRGVYAIDYRGNELIDRLQRIAPELHQRLRLLNANGFWLKAARPDLEWGFALPEHAGETLARTSPALWVQILHANEGQSRLGGGLLTWRRITGHDFSSVNTPVVTGDEFLVLASEISADEWMQFFAGTREVFFILTPILLLLTATSVLLFRSHRRASAALRRSEENVAVTLQSIGDAVLATDAAGNVARMNPVAEQLTGWTLAEACGRPIADVFKIIHAETRQPATIPVAEVLATGRVHSLAHDTMLIARDGAERSIGDSAAPIRERDGRIAGVVLVFRDVSAERNSENLRARLASIVESSDDAILSKRLDGTITSWNPAATRTFGYTADEAIGQRVDLIVPPDRVDDEHRILAQVAAGGNFAQLETVRCRKDRSRLDVSVTLSPIHDHAGAVIGVSSIIRDITRQRQAAEMLRQTTEEVRNLYNFAPCGYHSLDADGRFLAINDTELSWLGYRREEVVGRLRITDVLTAESRELFQQTFPRFKRDGALHGLELRMSRRDGTAFHALINATGVFDAEGRFVSSRSSVFDITARKEAEEELDRFFHLSLDFLCISSSDGFFKRVSPAVTDILGWTPEEFLARPYTELVHPDDLEATLREVERQVLHAEKVLQFENRYLHKDGTWRTLSWKSIPQPGGLMYATARDVTERRRDEEKVRELNTELQRHAAQLESANAELESFSYSVSHDLRAPLRHIQGYVEMLTREAQAQLSDKGRRYLKTIADSAREMGQLIDDLLLFSRMGRSELRETAIDLGQLVSDIRRDLALAAADRSIEWKIPAVPRVLGDPAMLRQVFVNLLDNAVKYTRGRDPAVIELGSAGEEDGRLILFVRDNGAGFDMRYADKLFGVFQRLHRAEEFEGTGIGLASVRRIVTRHGGRTWAQSQPGAGATFFLTLKPAPNP